MALDRFCSASPTRGRILDLGYGPGFDVTGVDFAERMISVVREKLPQARFVF
jgi:SAM-dependent methyltransferase